MENENKVVIAQEKIHQAYLKYYRPMIEARVAHGVDSDECNAIWQALENAIDEAIGDDTFLMNMACFGTLETLEYQQAVNREFGLVSDSDDEE